MLSQRIRAGFYWRVLTTSATSVHVTVGFTPIDELSSSDGIGLLGVVIISGLGSSRYRYLHV